MRHASLFRSTPFRLALTFAVLFILTFVLSGVVVYRMISANLADRLDQAVQNTYSVVAETYAGDDKEDLIATVESHARLNAAKEQLFSLVDPSGERLAGNFTAPNLPAGFSTLKKGAAGIPAESGYRAYSGSVGGNTLVVAQSYSETEEMETIALMGFGWATLLVTGLAVAGGALLASRVQKRLDGIAATMVSVSDGRLDARIPLTGKGDDIDEVSGRINAALERLATLVADMKQVSANIAHDLKTPLNRLQMILELAVEKTASGRDVSEDIAEARAESLQINETFDALLRIAQIEAGARKARFTGLRLNEVVDTIAEIYVEVAQEDGKTLSVRRDPEGPGDRIRGDRELLTQMLANLVENALRHCPHGTAIELSVQRQGGRVVATVADDGPGIPAEEREKVFQRLYRLDKSRSTSGNGLGLSLVRAIADLHGAKIELTDRHPGLAVAVDFPAPAQRIA